MSRKVDPRPARTRALLFEALTELIQEKRWDRIRVQDVLDRTGVGRSTFYAHYDNKFDLLTAEIPTLTLPIADAEMEPDLLPLFEHVEEMRPIMLPLMSQPLLGEIVDTFHRQLAAAWLDYLEALDIEAESRRVASELLAGGFMAVNREWLKSGCTPEPAVMSERFTGFMTAIIEHAKMAALR